MGMMLFPMWFLWSKNYCYGDSTTCKVSHERIIISYKKDIIKLFGFFVLSFSFSTTSIPELSIEEFPERND